MLKQQYQCEQHLYIILKENFKTNFNEGIKTILKIISNLIDVWLFYVELISSYICRTENILLLFVALCKSSVFQGEFILLVFKKN